MIAAPLRYYSCNIDRHEIGIVRLNVTACKAVNGGSVPRHRRSKRSGTSIKSLGAVVFEI